MREAVQEMRDLMVCPEALALLERSSREPLVGPPAAQKPPSDLLDARAISANALLFGRAAAHSRRAAGPGVRQHPDPEAHVQPGGRGAGRAEHPAGCLRPGLGSTRGPGWGSVEDGQDGRQWCAIAVLSGLLLLVLILLFAL